MVASYQRYSQNFYSDLVLDFINYYGQKNLRKSEVWERNKFFYITSTNPNIDQLLAIQLGSHHSFRYHRSN